MKGRLPPSKSEWIRAAILRSYEPLIRIQYDASDRLCDDIQYAEGALRSLEANRLANVGGSATAFRFAVLRASRKTGVHRVGGIPALLSRPHQPLIDFLRAVGVRVTVTDSFWEISSNGWMPVSGSVVIDSSYSSQFASAVFLNSIDLDSDLRVIVPDSMVSELYFKLSLSMLGDCGIEWTKNKNEYVIRSRQKLKPVTFDIEPDFSSAFAIAAYAALNRTTCIEPLPVISRHPDSCFSAVLEMMGAQLKRDDSSLRIHPSKLHAISWNLEDAPDLFPVLAVLCAFAKGESLLNGAPHLAFKESNRIEKISELFSKSNVRFEGLSGGLRIFGNGSQKIACAPFEFDPAGDHRVAMAAALLRSQGCDVKILNPDCVNKSFPGFWEMIS